MDTPGPLRIALIDDHELVGQGLTQMLEPFAGRVRLVDADARSSVRERVDVALFDPNARSLDVETLLAAADARRLAVYSWTLEPDRVKESLRHGADGCLSKCLSAADLVDALERINAGEIVVTEDRPAGRGRSSGHRNVLTVRESEIIALITQGLSNQEIAERAFLSINTIKSYIRSSYRKMNVTTRSQAVLWGIDHGMRPDYVRVPGPSTRS